MVRRLQCRRWLSLLLLLIAGATIANASPALDKRALDDAASTAAAGRLTAPRPADSEYGDASTLSDEALSDEDDDGESAPQQPKEHSAMMDYDEAAAADTKNEPLPKDASAESSGTTAPKPTSIYEKKYFDYLPGIDYLAGQSANTVQLDSVDVEFEPLVDVEDNDDDDDAFFEPAPSMLHDDEIVAVNRMKRDLFADSQRSFEPRRHFQLLDQHLERSLLDSRARAQQFASEANRWAASVQQPSYNPWHNRFSYPLGPSNVYLPVVVPTPPAIHFGYFYERPFVPFDFETSAGHNPGTPPDNQPPTKPVETVVIPVIDETKPTDNSNHAVDEDRDSAPKVTLNTRGIDDDDDLPVWGIEPISNSIAVTDSRQPNSISNSRPAANGAGGAAAQRPAIVEPPPLLHDSDNEDYVPPRPTPRPTGQAAAPLTPAAVAAGAGGRIVPELLHNSDAADQFEPPRPANRRPIAARPPTTSNSPSSGRELSGANGLSFTAPVWSGATAQQDGGVRRPSAPRTWRPPPTPPARLPAATGPTYCVWAIVDCCAHGNAGIRQACFERIGCDGAFWDVDPCSDRVLDAAVNEADRFFQ